MNEEIKVEETVEQEYKKNIDFENLIKYDHFTEKIKITDNRNIKVLNSKLIFKNINFDRLTISSDE
ncbi:MAG: hypothetical protein AABY36_04190, partial [Campylobacterota bacterium]